MNQEEQAISFIHIQNIKLKIFAIIYRKRV